MSNVKTIVASEGKIFRRKSDGVIFDKEITLGYTYYINDEKLDTPHLEVPEDFEEIDEIKEDLEESTEETENV